MFQHKHYFLACIEKKYELIDFRLCIVLFVLVSPTWFSEKKDFFRGLIWALSIGGHKKKDVLVDKDLW